MPATLTLNPLSSRSSNVHSCTKPRRIKAPFQTDRSFAWGLPNAIPKWKSFAWGKAGSPSCCIPVCSFPGTHSGIPAARRCILFCNCPFLYCALTHSRRGEEGLSWTGGWGRDGIWWRELHVKAWGKLSLSASFTLSCTHTHTHTHTHTQAAGEWRGFCRGRLCGRNVCNYRTTQTEDKWQCRLNSESVRTVRAAC